MEIVPEMIWSKLFITDKPWRNRRFSIKNRISNDYFEEDNDTKIERDDNENKGDTEKGKEEINSNNGVEKKRFLIYKKDMETHRIEIPFKNSITRKDEESNNTTDDPRNGGKMEEKLNQKNVIGGVPIYNGIYQGIENFSKAVISGFSSIRKTVSEISENVKEMIRDNESQDKDIKVREKVKLVDRNEKARNESNQCHEKNDVKLKIPTF